MKCVYCGEDRPRGSKVAHDHRARYDKIRRESLKRKVPIELQTGSAIEPFDPFHAPDWGWVSQ